jgi:hypothetical protein
VSSGHRVIIHERAGRRSVMLDGYIVDPTRVSVESPGAGKQTLVTLTLPVAELTWDVEGARVDRQVSAADVREAMVPEGVRRKVE